jgi:quercetin dioxygenase-like cupin family protein
VPTFRHPQVSLERGIADPNGARNTTTEEHTEENKMKRSLIVSGVAALIIAAASVGVAQAQKESSKNKTHVIYVAAAQATFKPSPMAGVSMAVLWGDPDKAAHGTFTKFAPGYDAGMHTHTSDVRLVVIKGAYLYKDEAGEMRVGPGDFIRIPGGHKHWSGGDKTEGALFYQEGSGKFDVISAK